jgi:hypothetical protein
MAGGAYGPAGDDFLHSLSQQTRTQIIWVQNTALRRSWQIIMAFGAVGFVTSIVMKLIPLREFLKALFDA